MSKLVVKNLSIVFGGLKAVEDVSFTVNDGEIFGLIGPNGAGKTTVFNMITGVYVPTTGQVAIDDTLLTGLKTYKISQSGIARTFQNIRLFKDMPVIDNIKVAMNGFIKYNLLDSIIKTPKYRKQEEMAHEKAKFYLDFLGLGEYENHLATNLPYGQQRKLEIARALASEPKILLLDEPAAGMNPTETAELSDIIRKIRQELNISIILIEHDMSFVMSLCERLVVLDYGKVIATGTPDEIKSNPQVIAAYLGGELSE